ncbi:Golgi apyrase [Beauveria bassiana]|uniref:Golgi apyrase n=1 Tax=Beauveria bassiana TaxID=176275 RepID=A0A2N6NXF1_BEABA|nr:Golgi apyrase [Beauveria bassiana]
MGKSGKNSQYGVVLDAGSSGTRVYVYKWRNPSAPPKHEYDDDDDEVRSLPKIHLKKNHKIHPGISTFADAVDSVGHDHLQELVDVALKKVPSHKIPETPIFLMATAGVRFLPPHKQKALLGAVCSYFKANTKFQLPDCDAHVQVIPGETEGLYGWIAANYLLGGFERPDEHRHSKGHHTYGFLDMGGASAQIAFAPNATEAKKHADDLKLVRMRKLDGSSVEYKVFTSTWLGYGANKARERFVKQLVDQYETNVREIPDPCLPKGLRMTLEGITVDSAAGSEQVLLGTGQFAECVRKTYPLLGKEKPCEDSPCLLNGQHAPAIDFDINHFVGVSEYWHTTHGVFGKEDVAYDLATYQKRVLEYCERDWSSIKDDVFGRKKTAEEKMADAQQACFKASWLINMLHDGIGIPRIGIEGGNGTHPGPDQKGFRDPFQPVDTIHDMEVSWTLGKMVLYAVGQIPAKDSKLPVGFGSNIDSGIPSDFEHAGSVPIPTGPKLGGGDDDDDDDVYRSSGSMLPFLIFLLLAMVLAYWLRKPDRRHRFFSFGRRSRKNGKGSRGFINKLLRRPTITYERVLEEGEAPEFELGGAESDENDHSDSTEGSKGGRSSGLATPKLNLERVDDFRMPSAMDRAGLAVRTESRERLVPSLQMLNAGRRSRNVSPTRMKSPLAVV